MIPWLDSYHPDGEFPPLEQALREPNGLLAAGGDLSPERLLRAYRHGVFPWYEAGQPILWWSPDPRAVLFPERLKISRSLRKTLRRGHFEVAFDGTFAEVIAACAAPRPGSRGTWITAEMGAAYVRLHELGFAHSVEVRRHGSLVGGLYGIALGKVFFGESMFSTVTDASKIALVTLCERLRHWGFELVDCQVASPHLASLGAEEIPRREFRALLDAWCGEPGRYGSWAETGPD